MTPDERLNELEDQVADLQTRNSIAEGLGSSITDLAASVTDLRHSVAKLPQDTHWLRRAVMILSVGFAVSLVLIVGLLVLRIQANADNDAAQETLDIIKEEVNPDSPRNKEAARLADERVQGYIRQIRMQFCQDQNARFPERVIQC